MVKKIKNKIKNLIKGFIGYILNAFSKPNRNAIWIFGFQKSGTSAIAGLLAHMGDKSVTIDTPYLWQPYSQRIKEGVLTIEDQVRRFSYPFSKDIIKEPAATFYIDKIGTFFHLEKYVFIVRNPIDNIKSILDRLNLPGDVDAIKLSDVHPNWRHKFPSDGKNYIGDLCNEWLLVNGQYKFMKDPRCILVKYEDFKKSKIEFITSLCEALDIEIKNDISNILNRQFQPKGNDKISSDKFFGANLSTIIQLCGFRMTELGYSIPREYVDE